MKSDGGSKLFFEGFLKGGDSVKIEMDAVVVSVKVASKKTRVVIETDQVKAPFELTNWVINQDPVRVSVSSPQQKLFKEGG